MTVSGEVSGEIGARNHFIDFDIDSTEFSDNCEAVASAIHLGCPVARSEAQRGYGVSADSTTCESVPGCVIRMPQMMGPVAQHREGNGSIGL